MIKVRLSNLAPQTVYDVSLTNPADSATESLGMVTTNDEGSGQFKLDTENGDALPFGVGSLAELEGFAVQVKDPDGKVVLEGTVCAARPEDDDEDDDDGDGDHHEEDDERARAEDRREVRPAVGPRRQARYEQHRERRRLQPRSQRVLPGEARLQEPRVIDPGELHREPAQDRRVRRGEQRGEADESDE